MLLLLFFVLYFLAGNWGSLVSTSVHNQKMLHDIYNGSGFRGIEHSILFNTDGISPYRSSHVTVWPILIALTKH